MNNPGPFFNPFMINEQNNYDKLNNKLERLEKDIKVLENRLNKLERIDKKTTNSIEPTDMYMI